MRQIVKFWKWFQDNEEGVKNAILLGINTDVIEEMYNRFKTISVRIGFKIMISPETGKGTFIISGGGYPKLFPKINAIVAQAPPLEYFVPEAFIKPIEDRTPYLKGEDDPYPFDDYEIKISEIYLSIADYNIATKQLRIKLHVPDFISPEEYEEAGEDMYTLLVDVLGEIAYKKHIKSFEICPLPEDTRGLFELITLQDHIDYLYKVNSRGKTRLI
ncbi:hypothetical protein [Flavobacterium sp. N1994]|uniref:hypothetical protein n=1 Tax=Flavobacterium sp. N1994 TaxID=2986827 RepID=UPI002222FA25|nr:hypothetical protein [Flavobacterium sp. N1994]